mgnify:FL=1
MKYTLCFLLALCSSQVFAGTSTDSNARINGAANFLLNRANDNFSYLFERQMAQNPYFRDFFPTTHQYVVSDRFKVLLRSSGDIWQKSIEDDLILLAKRVFAAFLSDTLTNTENVVAIFGQYYLLLSKLEFESEGKSYSLNNIPLNAPPNVREFINSFWEGAGPEQELWSKAEVIKKALGNSSKAGLNAEQINAINQVYAIAQSLQKQLEKIKTNIGRLKTQTTNNNKIQGNLEESIEKFAKEIPQFIKNTAYFLYAHEEYKKILAEPAQPEVKTDFVMRVIKVSEVLRRGFEEKVLIFKDHSDPKSFRRFLKYIIFFAEVADATTPQQVESLLDEVTWPSVSFGKKREPSELDWMITAYLGTSLSANRSSTDNQVALGLFAPVGLEYVLLRHKMHSLSLMIAPFDFSYPLNLEIFNKNAEAKLSDIIVPALYLSWGFKDLPLAVGLGCMRSRALKIGTADENRCLVFAGFDMPLFGVY